MPTVNDWTTALESIAPTALAEPWDNVGLLMGDRLATVDRVLLTIDLTPAVVAEAISQKTNLLLAYHPPLFKSIKQLPAALWDLARAGIAVYSPHTAWDCAAGGSNDVLADAIGLKGTRPLRPTGSGSGRGGGTIKLVTFLPADAVDAVASALFAAGAGNIGNYAHCSFRSAGTGTFFGLEGSQPLIGQTGRLERVDEIRLEVQVAVADVQSVLTALRTSHPYQEPAFDIYPLADAHDPSASNVGQGRVGTFDPPMPFAALVDRLKSSLQISHLLIAGDESPPVHRVAIVAGSGGDLLTDAIAAGADLFLTGELRHHDALAATAAGMRAICTLHTHSERLSLTRLRDRLLQVFPQSSISLSLQDREPFSIR